MINISQKSNTVVPVAKVAFFLKLYAVLLLIQKATQLSTIQKCMC